MPVALQAENAGLQRHSRLVQGRLAQPQAAAVQVVVFQISLPGIVQAQAVLDSQPLGTTIAAKVVGVDRRHDPWIPGDHLPHPFPRKGSDGRGGNVAGQNGLQAHVGVAEVNQENVRCAGGQGAEADSLVGGSRRAGKAAPDRRVCWRC